MMISVDVLKYRLRKSIEECQKAMDKVHELGFDISHPDYLQSHGAKWAYENVLEHIEDFEKENSSTELAQ